MGVGGGCHRVLWSRSRCLGTRLGLRALPWPHAATALRLLLRLWGSDLSRWGSRCRALVRYAGWSHELGLPELAPSRLAPRPLLPTPGDGGGHRVFHGLKTCSRARAWLPELSLAAREAGRGVNQWGFPCPQVI